MAQNSSRRMEVDYVLKRNGEYEEMSFEKILNRIKKLSVINGKLQKLIDSLDATELQDFIYSEIFALEMKLSSSIAQLIVGGQKNGSMTGHYMNISSLKSMTINSNIYNSRSDSSIDLQRFIDQ